MRSRPNISVAVGLLVAGAITVWCADLASTRAQVADLPIRSRGAAVPLNADHLPASQARLAFSLVRHLERSHPRGTNIVVSPASLAAVMALLDLGANAQMRTAIHRTLGFTPHSRRNTIADIEELRAAASGLQASADNGPLAIANAIVFDPASAPYERAVNRLRASGARAGVEDLSNPEASERALLVWMTRICPGPLDLAQVVKPEAILRWHRAGFQAFWR